MGAVAFDMEAVVERLMGAGEPWVVYGALMDLHDVDRESDEARAAYRRMVDDPRVGGLFDALETWPPEKPLSKAYDPKDSIWKLGMLADFGLRRDEPRIEALAERVFAAQAEDGGFLHGGFDHTRSWDARPYMCIAHVMTYALARFGYLDDPRLQFAYEQILAWQRLDGGFHPNKLSLPGAQRQDEPSCPFGTLNVLRALASNPRLRDAEPTTRAANYLLECWERRGEPYRPVGFGVGSTWDKAMFPFVQYGLLKEVDTLSMLPAARSDPRYKEMLDRLLSKLTEAGELVAESVNKPYSDFDFGQKKQPSAWLTFVALRALARGG